MRTTYSKKVDLRTDPRAVNISLGQIQCPFRTPHEFYGFGSLHCALVANHEGEHCDAHGYIDHNWGLERPPIREEVGQGPYRTPGEVKVDNYGRMTFGPITASPAIGFHGPAICVSRSCATDNFGAKELSVWDGQRNGVASVGLRDLSIVLSRSMWNDLKKAVDELFDEHEKLKRGLS